MKKLLLSILAGAAVATSANAQDAAPLTLSGSVDSYYRTTLNTSDQGANATTATSFANGVGFNIGMINLVASKEGEKGGFVADVVFGPRGDEATFADANGLGGSANVVNQLYAYWNINDMFTFTLGNFNTFLGYEVISPSVNSNYSTSHMFSYGPFSHTGAKLDIAATDQLSFMVAALNPTDIKTLTPGADTDGNNLFLGLQAGYEFDNGGVWVNYLGGNGGADGSDTTAYNQIDLTTGFDWTDNLYLGLNATVASMSNSSESDDNSGFWGIAGYATYGVTESFSLNGRIEYFSDKNGFVGLPYATDDNGYTNGSVMDLTLSGNLSFGDLTLIPEIRADFYLDAVDDASADASEGSVWGSSKSGDLATGLGSVALAAVYTF